MIATCPACHWSCTSAVSSHGPVAYVRCVCGLFLVLERGVLTATAGTSAFGLVRRERADQVRSGREPS
ncbi:hypothetical protein [Nocardia sp. NRRL S-836]|uniref:hypothetical protein n=1 Tax=Nocardia sp. NRRL S-836 TaxID=1519492 RepID=UPI0006AF41A6|nr:hypothetical protein [Nocardia sp. NRRL S-836]KOV89963.1 hypothetical protein ADL03_00785 [Nocardia sp. NRRL S-836]